MSGVRVHERRRLPFFMVGKPDLARLAGVCEARSLPYARSIYFALLELANDQRSDETAATRGEIAERAGVSSATVKRCVPMLVESGLVHVLEVPGEANRWTLLSGDDPGLVDPGSGLVDPGSVQGGRVSQTRGSGLVDPGLKDGSSRKEKTSHLQSAGRAREWPDVPEEMRVDAGALLKAKRKVNSQLVTEGELEIAAAALAEFNRQAESDFGLGANLTSIVMRVRERPSWDSAKHVRLVQSAWRVKWWTRNGNRRRPTPNVIYGERSFENVVQDARDEAAGKPLKADNGLRDKTWPDGRGWDELTPAEQAHARDAAMRGEQPWRETEAVAAASANGNGGPVKFYNSSNFLDPD